MFRRKSNSSICGRDFETGENVGIHPVLLFLTDTEAQLEKLNELLSFSHRTEKMLPVSIFSLQEKSENFETFLCRIADH